MAKDESRLENAPSTAVEADEEEDPIEIDGDDDPDLEETIRQAVAAVEEAERDEGPLEPDVDRLEREIADLRDRSARTLADFDNFRKRAERERQEIRRYALMEPVRDLLEVLDNLERAVAAPGSAEDVKQGVEMTLRQFADVLRRYGVSPVESEGRPFDPTVHEAVSREESEEVEAPTVTAELQKGYTLHERLVRPARVAVAVPVKDSGPPGGDEDED